MADYQQNIPAHYEDYLERGYQSEDKNTKQVDESGLDWNSVFPSRYLAKHWHNLPENVFPAVVLKELGYIVKHIRETESRFENIADHLRKTVSAHELSINGLIATTHLVKVHLVDVREAIATISKLMDETRLLVSALQKELYLAKTYPVNGSAIRLSPAGARRKIRTHVKKTAAGQKETPNDS